MLKLIDAGLHTTIQDGGREGFRQSGLSRCGALDQPALIIANLLVGNDPHAAGLEITFGQTVVQFARDGWFALTGAPCAATLDGDPVWINWRLWASAGQTLTLQRPLIGVRSYLAVAGGIDVPLVLGSRSTDLNIGIGGLQGRCLQDGDSLALFAPARPFRAPQGVKPLLAGNRIRALPGPEYHEFPARTQQCFWHAPWHLSPRSDRLAHRLHGQPLVDIAGHAPLLHGLLPGVVQVPADGQPVVLMNDAPTTGSDPRIACVIDADLYQMAQIPPDQPIHFIPCTLEEAQKAKLARQRNLQRLAWQLNQ